MFLIVLKNELKNISRDPTYIFFAAYPAIVGFGGYFLVDAITDPIWAKMTAALLIFNDKLYIWSVNRIYIIR